SAGRRKTRGQMMREGRAEEALATLSKELQENPNNNPVRQEFFRQRDYAISQWLIRAEAFRSAGQFDAADDLYPRVLKYDASNARATQGLAQTRVDPRHPALVPQAEPPVQAP